MKRRLESWLRAIIRDELARHDRENGTVIRYDHPNPNASFSGDFEPRDPIPFYRRFS